MISMCECAITEIASPDHFCLSYKVSDEIDSTLIIKFAVSHLVLKVYNIKVYLYKTKLLSTNVDDHLVMSLLSTPLMKGVTQIV